MNPRRWPSFLQGADKKRDVLGIAGIAGIMAAKKHRPYFAVPSAGTHPGAVDYRGRAMTDVRVLEKHGCKSGSFVNT